jgi:hypothetical protein
MRRAFDDIASKYVLSAAQNGSQNQIESKPAIEAVEVSLAPKLRYVTIAALASMPTTAKRN